MPRAAVSFKFEGVDKLIKKLERLPGATQRRVIRPAVSLAATPIVSAAKRHLPGKGKNASGTLRKSIGKRVHTGKRTGTVTAFIGVRKGIVGTFNGRKRNPRLYAHLVEFGTVHSAPRPFLRPAMTSAGPQAQAKLAARLRSGIEKLAAKN